MIQPIAGPIGLDTPGGFWQTLAPHLYFGRRVAVRRPDTSPSPPLDRPDVD